MSGSTRDGILSEIALSVKQNEVLHWVKWTELSEVLHLEGIRVSSGSKRARGAAREQTVLKAVVGLSWLLFIDLIYSCKCLESSRALTGSLSFFFCYVSLHGQ